VSRRRRKTYVVVTDPTWREWKALCVRRGATIEDELGRLVELQVSRARTEARRAAGRSVVARREIERLEAGG
jgi:hypothetical protein